MCGITGFYNISKSDGRQKLQRIAASMGEAIHMRGPDHADTWQDPELPLALAHRRLAIIDLSPEGAQPMASSSGRYVICYNGEIYNFLQLRQELEKGGMTFRGRSDTEVILAGIELWGLNLTLQKINGMFAFALWDQKDKTLHLVRDRFGKKPLYIGWAGSQSRRFLVFGSELKALRAHPDFEAKLNRDALASYMRYGYVPAPHCIYQKVWTLLPGHFLSLKAEDLKGDENLQSRMKPYWNHAGALHEAYIHPNPKSDDKIIREFEELLITCTQERMISDVPLGAFLSGGIDSSAVVALMQKIAARPVKTYTIGFEEAGFNEAEYARKVAAHLGTDHHELYVSGPDSLSVIPQMSGMYDEPFADISAIPTYLVSRFARRDVTVALSGDGGDEMLGGYNRHITAPELMKKMARIPQPLRKAASGLTAKIPTKSWDRLLPFIPQAGTRMHKAGQALALTDERELYQSLITRWPDPPSLVLNAGEASVPLYEPEWAAPEELGFAETMMYQDTISYLPNDILVKVDRASMAASLEARAPLLDKRIYDYVWALPLDMKIRGGKGKWLLRQVLARHVPTSLFERPKQGFNIPVGDWLRGPLRDWAETLLDESALHKDGILNAAPIRACWDEHRKGQGNHADKLWTVLMFQAWKEKWM